ncbi:MAG: hypothetical protein NTW21_21135 [Verrucomicrobia bacterium]|nr:hypothetical protein [Verrucomicrobiota bacterium]
MKTSSSINPMNVTLKHLALAVAVVAGLGVTSTHAAINVDGSSSGSGILTFDTIPAVTEWSTAVLATGSGGAQVTTLAGMDTFVNTLEASTFPTILGTVTADPVNTTTTDGRWNSTALRLTTRAGTTPATCLLATLLNTSGAAINELAINFTLSGSAAASEDAGLAGYALYCSLTGAASSWQRIGVYGTLGAVNTSAVLSSAWADTATLYVLWVDDNGAGGGDGWYGIDDVSFAKAAPGANILTFGLPGNQATIAGTNIAWYVPDGTDVTALSPEYTLSYGASCDPASGSSQNFTSPVTYTVTPSEGLAKVYTVTVGFGLPLIDVAGDTTGNANLQTIVGAGNRGRLLGNFTLGWASNTGTFTVPLDTNGFLLQANTGGGNYNHHATGPISGSGSFNIMHGPHSNGFWNSIYDIDGTTANTYTGGTIIQQGLIRLNKTAGVDALPAGGTITLGSAGRTARLLWGKSHQINDLANITVLTPTVTNGATSDANLNFLDLAGFSERIEALTLGDGGTKTQVRTGLGGVLNVKTLTVNGVTMPKGAYPASSGFVTGTGYIDVDDFGPPVIATVPDAPTTPTPTDGSATSHPAYLAKLQWAVCAGATNYDVYLWLAPEAKPGTPTANVALYEYAVSPQVLSLATYKWQVVAKNAIGDTAGPEWTFSTVDRKDISGNLTLNLDAIVGAGPARLTANATSHWGSETSGANVNLNGFQFTINSGNGNAHTYNGAITGPGTLRLQGRYDASWPTDPQLGGTVANSPDSVTIESGRVVLNKTDGVDALAGAITVIPAGGNTVRIQLLKSNQINDASTITSTATSGAFHLEMGGFSETISGLTIKTGDTVDTGAGGVLTVSTLTVNGEVKLPGTYTATDGWVTGTGSVVVPGAGITYGSWAATNAGGQAADLDYNSDGVPNGVAYFMGMTGLATHSGVVAGKVTWPRDPTAVATFMVQVSDNLTGWTDLAPPDPSIDETNPNQVTYTLPTGALRKFCRLVVITP